MPHADTVELPNSEAGFADLLASLAVIKESSANAVANAIQSQDQPADDEDQLADDVAILSYESALKAHGRNNRPATGRPDAGHGGESSNTASLESGAAMKARRSGPKPVAAGGLNSDRAARERKCSSITVRMSGEECRQLHERAAEAGITVSAYLRSCAFEVESLRAQVKQTLAELRSANGATVDSPQESPRNSHSGTWLKRLWPRKRDALGILRDGDRRRAPGYASSDSAIAV
jgi:hypothetical protein